MVRESVFASAIPRIACVFHSTFANWHREGGREGGRERERDRERERE